MNPGIGQMRKQNSGFTVNENDISHELAFKNIEELSNQFDSEARIQAWNSHSLLKFNNGLGTV